MPLASTFKGKYTTARFIMSSWTRIWMQLLRVMEWCEEGCIKDTGALRVDMCLAVRYAGTLGGDVIADARQGPSLPTIESAARMCALIHVHRKMLAQTKGPEICWRFSLPYT
jgi:hypothetical protein